MRLNYLRLAVALIALAFTSITFAAPAIPAVTNTSQSLSWTACTQNEDETPVTDLAGYHIWHRVGNGSFEAMPATVPASALTYTYPALADGTHFFAVTCFTPNAESGPSKEVSVVIASVCTAPPPRMQSCATPLTGSWQQTAAPGDPPACTPGEWLPAAPPAGVCTSAAPMTTASTSAYQFKSATLPMSLVGMTSAGAQCGPETKTVNGVKYCRIPKSAVDLVVWPSDLSLNDYWVRTQ